MKILFKKLTVSATIPRINKKGDAGFDIYADESVVIWVGGQAVISTGIACEIPTGWVGQIWSRSGMAVKHMIDVHAGIIDSNYRGEIKACLINHGDRRVEIKKGDRIAQMVVTPFLGESEEVSELSDSNRNKNGFGSSGV